MYASAHTHLSAGRGLGDSAPAEARQPEIPEQLDLLRNQVAVFGDSLNALLNRIGPVRRTPLPTSDGNKVSGPIAVPRPLQSPMAVSLENIRVDVQRFSRGVEDALFDLELP